MPEQFLMFGLLPHTAPLSMADAVCDCANCHASHLESDSREHEGGQFCPECRHCPACGNVYAAEEGYDVNGADHCPECVHHCERCEFVTVDDRELHLANSTCYGPHRHDTEYRCEECSWQCADCNSWFTNDADKRENADGEAICERCGESYSSCEECNVVLHQDDAHYHEGRSCTYCEDCMPAEDEDEDEDEDDSDSDSSSEDSDRVIHRYTYKPSAEFLRAKHEKTDRTTLFLGWEIEVDRKQEATSRESDIESAAIPSVVYCKEDGSLVNGFEMVSHPGTWRYWQREFNWQFTQTLRDKGYRSYDTTTCGMHVHVSKSALTALDRFKLLSFFRWNEAIIARLSRREICRLNEFARISTDATPGLIERVKKRRLDHGDRYTAINLDPQNPTVEFRIFRGTLNPKSVKRNLAFCVALCHFVKDSSLGEMTLTALVAWLRVNGERIIGRPQSADMVKWIESARHSACSPDVAA